MTDAAPGAVDALQGLQDPCWPTALQDLHLGLVSAPDTLAQASLQQTSWKEELIHTVLLVKKWQWLMAEAWSLLPWLQCFGCNFHRGHAVTVVETLVDIFYIWSCLWEKKRQKMGGCPEEVLYCYILGLSSLGFYNQDTVRMLLDKGMEYANADLETAVQMGYLVEAALRTPENVKELGLDEETLHCMQSRLNEVISQFPEAAIMFPVIPTGGMLASAETWEFQAWLESLPSDQPDEVTMWLLSHFPTLDFRGREFIKKRVRKFRSQQQKSNEQESDLQLANPSTFSQNISILHRSAKPKV